MRHHVALFLAGLLSLTAVQPANAQQHDQANAPFDIAAARQSGEGRGHQPLKPTRPIFKLHELSRRQIAFEMAPAKTKEGQGGPSPTPIRNIALEPQIGANPGIAIPLWMRGLRERIPQAGACTSEPYYPTGFLKLDEEANRQTYFQLMSQAACANRVPTSLLDALIIRESRYNPLALSTKKAFGLTQLMPATAADLKINRYDVIQNLHGGASYLRKQLDRFGAYHLALAAYNAGPGRVRGGGIPAIPETRDYVASIMRNWSRLARKASSQPETSELQNAIAHRITLIATY